MWFGGFQSNSEATYSGYCVGQKWVLFLLRRPTHVRTVFWSPESCQRAPSQKDRLLQGADPVIWKDSFLGLSFVICFFKYLQPAFLFLHVKNKHIAPQNVSLLLWSGYQQARPHTQPLLVSCWKKQACLHAIPLLVWLPFHSWFFVPEHTF